MFKRPHARINIFDPEAQVPQRIMLCFLLLSALCFAAGIGLYFFHFADVPMDSFDGRPKGVALASVSGTLKASLEILSSDEELSSLTLRWPGMLLTSCGRKHQSQGFTSDGMSVLT